jgi:hypothetical protein
MIYIPCFIKIGSGIQKLIGVDTRADTGKRQEDDVIRAVLLF